MKKIDLFDVEISLVSARPSMYGLATFKEFICYMEGFRRGIIRQAEENKDREVGNKAVDPLEGFSEYVSVMFDIPRNVCWDYILIRTFGNTIESIGRFMSLYKSWQTKKSADLGTIASGLPSTLESSSTRMEPESNTSCSMDSKVGK